MNIIMINISSKTLFRNPAHCYMQVNSSKNQSVFSHISIKRPNCDWKNLEIKSTKSPSYIINHIKRIQNIEWYIEIKTITWRNATFSWIRFTAYKRGIQKQSK